MKLYALAFPVLLAAATTQPGGCDDNSHEVESRLNEDSQQRLAKAVPPPQLKTSLERKNLVRRLELINQESKVGYIYLISDGHVMATYTVSGKVSSLNSYLTAMERIEMRGQQPVTIEAPDLDGSYGKNPEGIFFFTVDGTYVEWKGQYLWADRPLKMRQPPELSTLTKVEE